MKKQYLLLTFLTMFSSFIQGQMKEPYEWVGYENVMKVKNGLRHYDYDVKTLSLIHISEPTRLL